MLNTLRSSFNVPTPSTRIALATRRQHAQHARPVPRDLAADQATQTEDLLSAARSALRESRSILRQYERARSGTRQQYQAAAEALAGSLRLLGRDPTRPAVDVPT